MLYLLGNDGRGCSPANRTPKAKKEEASTKSPADLKFEEMQQYANNLDVQVWRGR